VAPCVVRPAIVADAALRRLVRRARACDPSGESPDLGRHLVVTAPHSVDLDLLCSELSGLEHVQRCRVRPPGPDPVVLPTSNPEFEQAAHLRGSELWPRLKLTQRGADMAHAWRHAGGDGRFVEIVDIERGWDVLHEDLREHDVAPPLCGVSWPDSRAHGTAVLGVICALDNAVGTVGVVPSVARVRVASTICAAAPVPPALQAWTRASAQGDANVRRAVSEMTEQGWSIAATAEALKLSAAAMEDRPGVILLESQTVDDLGRELPAEYDADVREMIWTIVAAGVPVIAVAGNGGVDLDGLLPDRRGAAPDDRPWERDSGSILVGAVRSFEPHDRMAGTNHGAAVDVWAWGDHVRTTRLHPTATGETIDTYGWIGGTSAAAAVVTGIALSLQSIAVAHGDSISPRALRGMLRSRSRPLPPIRDLQRASPADFADAPPAADLLPSLGRLLDAHFELPFPYLRCTADDDGSSECDTAGPSPDVRPSADGTGILVRVLNRGRAEASDVVVAVYESQLCVSPAPWLWRHVESVTIDAIAAGTSAEVRTNPGNGSDASRSFIGVLGIGGDAPATPEDLAPPGHLRWMQNEMHAIAVRSAVTTHLDESLPIDCRLSFLVTGEPDRDAECSIAVEIASADATLDAELVVSGESSPHALFLAARSSRPATLRVSSRGLASHATIVVTVVQTEVDGAVMGRLRWELSARAGAMDAATPGGSGRSDGAEPG